MSWPTTGELEAMGLYLYCPDCGRWLWDALEQRWLEICPDCGWPTYDWVVEDGKARANEGE